MKHLGLAALCLMAAGCQSAEQADQKSFSEFDSLCREQSSEFVTDGAAAGRVLLTDEFEPSFPGPGRANRGVFDAEYGSSVLLRALVTGPDKLDEVRFRYELIPRSAPQSQACKGFFYADVSNSEESQPTQNCQLATRWNRETDRPRYEITLEYGALDSSEIRPFTFQLRDVVTGQVVAEQRSFQLLLGGMAAAENRSFTWAGFAQRARTCRLTPPDQLIKRAFRKGYATSI